MKARITELPPRVRVAIAAALVLLYAAATWFVFVAPKRADAAKLSDQITAAELRLVEAQAAARRTDQAGVQVAELFRLAKAMPSSADQAGMVLELTRLAEQSRVALRSIVPQAAAEGAGGATMIPVAVTLEGSFGSITRFLTGVRTLVTVDRGRLRSTGRLFSVQDVELVESLDEGFPTLDATVTLHAYVYDGPIAPPEVPRSTDEDLQPTGGAAAAGSTSS